MNAPLQIAIDGPVASGKGDIAARLAIQLNLLYIYTGAMYRALALACIRQGISCKDENQVMEILKKITIQFVPPPEGSRYFYTILLNGEDITERITKQDTAQGASDVGILPLVRQWMVQRQKEMSQGKRVVMEGRDIGLRVLPNAQLKIFLTASVEERAQRRFGQWQEKGIHKTFEETLADTKLRDLQDTTRSTDPLHKLTDAWELDTTQMDQEEVVTAIIEELKRRKLI
ncbi:cytidylate kinase [Candidatus Gottesmanbacteria bacterium RBG_13_45_10]|uniref:Cytidylate kinase n=1 Tax=Candidatus Gottesmanbacteria bacterium RBG_13_45_10 TaxID=1798370 RepID=A0A1F5ZHP9_9BACT|nr:MAG: cytidylate kinase [Candidatus Gottesmanbacteria bacterium RBG_13_45_10]